MTIEKLILINIMKYLLFLAIFGIPHCIMVTKMVKYLTLMRVRSSLKYVPCLSSITFEQVLKGSVNPVVYIISIGFLAIMPLIMTVGVILLPESSIIIYYILFLLFFLLQGYQGYSLGVLTDRPILRWVSFIIPPVAALMMAYDLPFYFKANEEKIRGIYG